MTKEISEVGGVINRGAALGYNIMLGMFILLISPVWIILLLLGWIDRKANLADRLERIFHKYTDL